MGRYQFWRRKDYQFAADMTVLSLKISIVQHHEARLPLGTYDSEFVNRKIEKDPVQP